MKKMFPYFLFLGMMSTMIGCQETAKAPAEQTTVQLSEKRIELQPGDIHQLDVQVTPISSESVVWSSSNTDVATVFYGKVTGKQLGEAQIIATCEGVSDTCFVTVSLKDYTLVWSDEFDGNSLNTNVWNIEVNGNGGGNNELQYYRAENVSVGVEPTTGKNCLMLTARKESYNGKSATSGRINSQNNVTFTHGMIESSIYIPYTANGIWPAFWMMGNDISSKGWPACGEIDIMEMGHSNGIKNGTQDRYFNGACHWGAYVGGSYPNYAQNKTADYSIQGGFHTFRCYWDEEKISMYLDQDLYPDTKPYFEMLINQYDTEMATGNYFHKPNFILFNLAVGGNFPGIWDINQVTGLNNGDVTMYVDYVRVYQRGLASETLFVK